MKKPYTKVYISLEDENSQLVIDGPLELLRQFLAALQQPTPSDEEAAEAADRLADGEATP